MSPPRDPKHIVIFRRAHAGRGWGGCERRLLNYFSRTDFAAAKISIVSNCDIYTEPCREIGVPIEVHIRPEVFTGSSWHTFRATRRVLAEFEADHVILVFGAHTDFRLAHALGAAVATQRSVVNLEVLGAKAPKKGWGPRGLLRRVFGLPSWTGRVARRTLTASREVADRLVDDYGYPRSRTIPIFNGVDHQRLRPSLATRHRVRDQLGIGRDELIFISTARLSNEKCMDKLIDTFDEGCGNAQNAWLLILGDGEELPTLQQHAAGKPSSERIRFLGYEEDVAPFLQASDYFVLVSRIEGLANALLEAMSCGLTCYATRTPGPSELIDDQIDGFLLGHDPSEIAQALATALSRTAEERAEIGKSARSKMVQNFPREERIREAMRLLEFPGVPQPTPRGARA